MKPVCNLDCFHCPYEDCINDELFLEDYKAEKELDFLSGAKEYKTPEDIRAAQKKYYEENKEKWKEYNRRSRQKKKNPPALLEISIETKEDGVDCKVREVKQIDASKKQHI